jgi:hypothetical protein
MVRSQRQKRYRAFLILVATSPLDVPQFLFLRLLTRKLTVRIVGQFEWTELRLHCIYFVKRPLYRQRNGLTCSILKFVCINLRWPHRRFDRSLHHPGSSLLPLPELLQLLPALVQQRLRWRSPAPVVLFAHQISHTWTGMA